MQYVLSLCDDRREHLVVFSLRESDVKRPASDFFFDIVASTPAQLAEDEIINAGQADDLLAMQQRIFAEDSQGIFIREDVSISSNGRGLNPDAPLKDAFVEAEREGIHFMRSETIVSSAPAGASQAQPQPDSKNESENVQLRVETFSRIWFIWQIANGYAIDCTKEDPALIDSIAEAEKNGWIDIDVKQAAYKLTASGLELHNSYKAEAQELIRRYDIYGDVDLDYDGNVHFDSELGRDLRIPIFELEGIDPFRARLIIGLNDGEWRDVPDWPYQYRTREFYDNILKDVALAPSIEEVGREVLMRVEHFGKEQLRADSQYTS